MSPVPAVGPHVPARLLWPVPRERKIHEGRARVTVSTYVSVSVMHTRGTHTHTHAHTKNEDRGSSSSPTEQTAQGQPAASRKPSQPQHAPRLLLSGPVGPAYVVHPQGRGHQLPSPTPGNRLDAFLTVSFGWGAGTAPTSPHEHPAPTVHGPEAGEPCPASRPA